MHSKVEHLSTTEQENMPHTRKELSDHIHSCVQGQEQSNCWTLSRRWHTVLKRTIWSVFGSRKHWVSKQSAANAGGRAVFFYTPLHVNWAPSCVVSDIYSMKQCLLWVLFTRWVIWVFQLGWDSLWKNGELLHQQDLLLWCPPSSWEGEMAEYVFGLSSCKALQSRTCWPLTLCCRCW